MIWATARQNQQNDLCTQRRLNSSLCAQRVAKNPRFLHAVNELWSDWADAQAELSLCWAHRLFCWFCDAVAHLCSVYIEYIVPYLSCYPDVNPLFIIKEFYYEHYVIAFHPDYLFPEEVVI